MARSVLQVAHRRLTAKKRHPNVMDTTSKTPFAVSEYKTIANNRRSRTDA